MMNYNTTRKTGIAGSIRVGCASIMMHAAIIMMAFAIIGIGIIVMSK